MGSFESRLPSQISFFYKPFERIPQQWTMVSQFTRQKLWLGLDYINPLASLDAEEVTGSKLALCNRFTLQRIDPTSCNALGRVALATQALYLSQPQIVDLLGANESRAIEVACSETYSNPTALVQALVSTVNKSEGEKREVIVSFLQAPHVVEILKITDGDWESIGPILKQLPADVILEVLSTPEAQTGSNRLWAMISPKGVSFPNSLGEKRELIQAGKDQYRTKDQWVNLLNFCEYEAKWSGRDWLDEELPEWADLLAEQGCARGLLAYFRFGTEGVDMILDDSFESFHWTEGRYPPGSVAERLLALLGDDQDESIQQGLVEALLEEFNCKKKRDGTRTCDFEGLQTVYTAASYEDLERLIPRLAGALSQGQLAASFGRLPMEMLKVSLPWVSKWKESHFQSMSKYIDPEKLQALRDLQ